MSAIAILYASHHGQTARIAERIARRLGEHGFAAQARDLRALGPGPLDVDLIVLGSPVWFGRHLGPIVRLARERRRELERHTTALFSVSMAAREDLAEAARYVERLRRDTGFSPSLVATFAGALPYRKYGLLTRLFMVWTHRARGWETDTARDHEYTDWNAVDAFADQLAARLRPPARRASPASTATTDEEQERVTYSDEEAPWPAS